MRTSLRLSARLPAPSIGVPPTIRAVLAAGPSVAEGATASCKPAQTEVHGWIRSVRAHKNVAFAELDDGSGGAVQAVLKGKGRAEGLTLGASVAMRGTLLPSRGAGQALELLADDVRVLGASEEGYPLQKKALPAALLREHAHLRFRTGQSSAVARVRDALARDWHDWFEEHEFVHVHTPLLTASDCEGAGEVFRLQQAPDAPFFGRPVNLTVSGQLHLEAPTHSLGRVYTLSPCFRAEESQTARHLSEFYMLEGELAFVDALPQLLDVVERGVRGTLQRLLEDDSRRAVRARADLAQIARYRRADAEAGAAAEDGEEPPPADPLAHLRAAAYAPFARVSYADAIRILAEEHAAVPFQHAPAWDAGLTSEQEKWLAGTYFGAPVFVTDYPAAQKPFYMLPSAVAQAADAALTGAELPPPPPAPTVAAFDLLFPGIGEMAGGSLREHRLEHLEAAIEANDLDPADYRWYLELRKYGSVPHGGWGMGWERWVSWVTGVPNVRDVVAFPRWVGNCRF